MLIAYAGQEKPATNRRQINAYNRFMAGANTLQIATFYRVAEEVVLRWISVERSKRRGLPSPYAK